MLIALFFVLTTLSCNNEEIFSEDNGNTVVDPDTTENTDVPSEDTNDSTVDATLPCSFGLDSVQSGDTIVINCILDLGGQTVNLPSNVTIVYEGGDIINGTLNFSDSSVIDGALLNSSLTLGGSKPQLKDTTFQFDPQRWGIVEGKVSDDVALNNKKILQTIINQVKDLGITTFEIDKMDAYFAIGGPNLSLDSDYINNGIHLPSDFNLKMSSNTFLRVQPNKWFRSVLLGAYIQSNITITGGNLIGDRYTHDYSPINDVFGISRNSHESPVLILIGGCKNVVIDGVYMKDSTGDGLIYGSGTNRLYTPAVYCENVIVKNCTISGSRRNNVTFGDGEYLTLENCTITNAGGGTPVYDSSGTRIYDSSGVAPQLGVDLEAHRELDSNGNYIDYQKVEQVTIRGNTFTGNYTGDIVVFTANDVLIENNNCDNTIGGTLFYNTTIQNNTLIQNPNGIKTSTGIGFNAIIRNNEHKTKNIKISGNSISGYDTGISPGGQFIEVNDNVIRDFIQAIYLRNIVDSEISNNDYESSRAISYGYMSYNGISNNLLVKNDKVTVNHRPIMLSGFNTSSDISSLTFDSCNFSSTKELYFENTNNITLKNNNLLVNKQIKQINCLNILLENNN